MSMLNGKVALVTGAGGGLGRAYALLFAKEGAKVVVNDLGGSRDGTGADTMMADKVVAEIREAGGEAVANYGSVADPEDAQAMVEQAYEAFGQLDVVVNNAGILRDKTLVKMTDEMWKLVQQVHLDGTFLVTRAAVRAMMEKGTPGRIVNTSSLAGLKGNFGQANYGAAKAGIAGLTRVVALETRKFGITVNAVAPVAKTRMTDDIDMVPEDFEPEDIAPLVAWLASDEAKNVTGRIFGAHGSHYFEYLVETTPGVELGDERWTPQLVGKRFEEITAKPKAPSAAAADEGPLAQAKALFEAVPATFKADKAGDWRANIVFDIGGQATYSLVVGDGKAAFQEGAADSPTGKVTLDGPDTILAMATGKLAPEQAFMSGKISTDNMGVLMKFGQYFDLAAAAAALPGDEGDQAGDGPADVARAIFEAVPRTFKADKAGDWAANLLFDVGGTKYALVIGEGKAEFRDGGVDSPDGKVVFDSADTVVEMATGKLAPEQAFMSGKVSTDNMGALMKFGQYFDLAAAARQVGTSSGGGGAAKKGVNEACVGKKFRGAAHFVEPQHASAYAAATDDANAHFEGPEALAPPIFPVRPLFSVLTQAVTDAELNADLLRLVHGEQDMRFHRHLEPWDLVAPRAEIASIETKSSGQLINVRQWLVCEGEVTTEVVSGIFIRGESRGGDKSEKKSSSQPEEPREIVHEESKQVADDQPLRYADASLDRNPIHVDPQVAAAAGHPSVILHGLCTMAFAGQAVVNGPCDGDPRRLQRLKVRFSKPVLPGWTLTTRVWKLGESDGVLTLGLETVNQDGVAVITNGLAEIAI